MPTDYYDEEVAAPQHAPRETNPEGTEGMRTAVIPTAMLPPDFQVGDRVTFRVDSIQGDQVAVSPAPAEGSGEPGDDFESTGNDAMPPEGLPTEMASEGPDYMET